MRVPLPDFAALHPDYACSSPGRRGRAGENVPGQGDMRGLFRVTHFPV